MVACHFAQGYADPINILIFIEYSWLTKIGLVSMFLYLSGLVSSFIQLMLIFNFCSQVNNQSTSPIQFGVDKSVQAKIKTSREKGLEKRNKFWAQKVRRLNKSVKTLKSLMKTVKCYASNSEIDNIIQGNFANICKEFKKPSKSSPHSLRYSDEVKSFALTLHFYSAKAYDFLRKYVALPHVETLRRSLSTFNCNVGFLTEVLEYLKVQLETQEKPFLKNVALIFDGMALRQDLAYDQKLDKVFGYVDLGEISVSNPEELATEALVFQIVSYTTYFKCPIAYFLIKNSLSGDLLAELLKTAVTMLDDIGITVRSMTCDGAPSNVKAYECLGCSLDQNNFKPHIPHPNGQDNIYCFLDAAHMIKLARNVFAEFNIQSATGTTSFQYLRQLHEVQKEEGLKFGNKLSTTHVDYQNKKMNVKLAAQVLSSSVADSIDFLRQSGNLLFLGSEPTVEFIKMMDRLFDLMNSKSPFGHGFKSPLSEKNKAFWEPILKESKNYLLSLTIDGKNILSHGRKTFALGFLMGIENFPLLLNDLSKDPINPIKYLLTFKCSQDNIEILFSCIRARGRTHDNPSPLEFRYRMRKLLFRNSIQPSINANSVDHTFEASHVFDYGQKNVSLIDSTTDDDSEDYTQEMENQLYALELESKTTVTEYQKNILYYMTGYIVKQIIKSHNCNDCKNMLIAPEHSQSDHFYNLNINRYQSFTVFVNRGKLCFPSAEAYSIVVYADKVFKNMLNMDKLTSFNIKNKMINLVNQHFTSKLRQMFCHPTDDSVSCTDLHESKIVKLISNSFLSIRLRSYLKNVMDKKLSAIRSKRQKLHKTIIFNHV